MKWWCALIGFCIFNLPGALIGYWIGELIDNRNRQPGGYRSRTDTGESPFSSENGFQSGRAEAAKTWPFCRAVAALTAEVIRTDGCVSKGEILFVKMCFLREFGEKTARRMMGQLKTFIDGTVPLAESSILIHQLSNGRMKNRLIHFLYQVAQSDGNLSEAEEQKIFFIARSIGLSEEAAAANRFTGFTDTGYQGYRRTGGSKNRGSQFYQEAASSFASDDLTAAYALLGITETATDEAVKKAYKKSALRYHPDRFAASDPKAQAKANERFAKINAAYDRIQRERNLH